MSTFDNRNRRERHLNAFVAESYPPPLAQHLPQMAPVIDTQRLNHVQVTPTPSTNFDPFGILVAERRHEKADAAAQKGVPESDDYYYYYDSSYTGSTTDDSETSEEGEETEQTAPQQESAAPLLPAKASGKQSAPKPTTTKTTAKTPAVQQQQQQPPPPLPSANLPPKRSTSTVPTATPPAPASPVGIMDRISSFFRSHFWAILTLVVVLVAIGIAFLFVVRGNTNNANHTNAANAGSAKPPDLASAAALEEIVLKSEQAAVQEEENRHSAAKQAADEARAKADSLQQELEAHRLAEKERLDEIERLHSICQTLLDQKEELTDDNKQLLDLLQRSGLLLDDDSGRLTPIQDPIIDVDAIESSAVDDDDDNVDSDRKQIAGTPLPTIPIADENDSEETGETADDATPAVDDAKSDEEYDEEVLDQLPWTAQQSDVQENNAQMPDYLLEQQEYQRFDGNEETEMQQIENNETSADVE